MKHTLVVILVIVVLLLPACEGSHYYPPSSGNPPPETSLPPDSTTEKLSTPLNVRIDYIGVKDTKGDNDYGEDPFSGEIQLVIVITDGDNEPQTCYIPQETQEGLEGFQMGDFEVKKINRQVYHTASAGDYLRLSIMAYDLDSNDNLMTDAAIVELLGEIAGVPEAGIIKQLVSSLPEKDNDLVGEYEGTWYADENYGIGQKSANCLDRSADENFFVWFSVWSDEIPSLPERPTMPGVPEVQTLKRTMYANPVTGSYAQYQKHLQAGENVSGSLRLTGTYVSGLAEWDHTCCFWVYDPDGNEINEWCGEFKEDGLYHEFSFTVSRSGEHTIKVEHVSNYNRELYIKISPYGWE